VRFSPFALINTLDDKVITCEGSCLVETADIDCSTCWRGERERKNGVRRVYIYRERDREEERGRGKERKREKEKKAREREKREGETIPRGIRKGSVQNIFFFTSSIRDVLTARESSIGSSGGTTLVRTIIQFNINL